MALINFYKGLKENYSPDTHGNSIYSCTDTNECYILGVLYENISEQEIADKIGTNTYTDANYISKETNLTDATMQLDEEIKATNDNLAILNAASVKSVKVGSNTSNEQFSSGVITIANATTSTDGALSKEDKTKIDNIENTYVPLTGGTLTGDLNLTSSSDINVEGDVYAECFTSYRYIELEDQDGGTRLRVADANSSYSQLDIGDETVPLVLYSSTDIKRHLNSTTLYTIYDSGNFIAGTNYVAPEDVRSLVFTQSAGANETNAANYLKVRDGYFNIVVAHNDKYYTPNEINTTNPDSIAILFSTFIPTGYNIYKVTVTADGTCTESLFTSFTIPTVNVVSEFPTELDNYADGSIFIKE